MIVLLVLGYHPSALASRTSSTTLWDHSAAGQRAFFLYAQIIPVRLAHFCLYQPLHLCLRSSSTWTVCRAKIIIAGAFCRRYEYLTMNQSRPSFLYIYDKWLLLTYNWFRSFHWHKSDLYWKKYPLDSYFFILAYLFFFFFPPKPSLLLSLIDDGSTMESHRRSVSILCHWYIIRIHHGVVYTAWAPYYCTRSLNVCVSRYYIM